MALRPDRRGPPRRSADVDRHGQYWLPDLLQPGRYAVHAYSGEPIFVGFFRTPPGPKFWAFFYLLIDLGGIWPYWASNAAVPLAAAILGHLPGPEDDSLVRTLGYAIVDRVPPTVGGFDGIMTGRLGHPKRTAGAMNRAQDTACRALDKRDRLSPLESSQAGAVATGDLAGPGVRHVAPYCLIKLVDTQVRSRDAVLST